MTSSALVLSFVDRAALEREHTTNFLHGRAFVSDATGHDLFSTCLLVVEHPDTGDCLELACEVVMVLDQGAMRGIALQFRDRDPIALARITAFVASNAARTSDPDVPGDEACETWDDDEADTGEYAQPSETEARNPVQERQLRLRNLGPLERMKVAKGSVLEDRVALERIYGTMVWETLLRNPKVTVPEIARMARKGTMPRPLLELIVENENWIRQSIVRRALLSNPRLSPEGATKVLRSMSSRELKLVPQQTAYPAIVRATAARMLKG